MNLLGDAYREQVAQYDALIANFIRANQLAIDELTEKQVSEAIKQAFASGDFQKLVVAGTGAQSIIYIPFNREQELLKEIDRLKLLLRWANESGC